MAGDSSVSFGGHEIRGVGVNKQVHIFCMETKFYMRIRGCVVKEAMTRFEGVLCGIDLLNG